MDDAIDLGDILDTVFAGPDKKFSFSLWYKPSGAIPNNRMLIGKNADSACGENSRELNWSIYQNKLAFIYQGDRFGSAYRIITGSTSLDNPSHWYHLVLTYDGQVDTGDGLYRVGFYIDGVRDSTTLLTSVGPIHDIGDTGARLTVGSQLSSSGTSCGPVFLSGTIDDVRVYATALTQEEVSDVLSKQGS